MKWKVNDWCFHEFDLFQIIEMNDNKIITISNGEFSRGGSNLTDRCFPLDLSIKTYSYDIAKKYDKILSLNVKMLSYSNIRNEYVRIWEEMCKNKENVVYISELYAKAHDFTKKIINSVYGLMNTEIGGVKILK